MDAIMNDRAVMPGTSIEVAGEQAESFTDAWQAFELDKPITMCWQGTKGEAKTKRSHAKYESSFCIAGISDPR